MIFQNVQKHIGKTGLIPGPGMPFCVADTDATS